MKRLYTCIVIVCIIITLSAGSLFITRKSNDTLFSQLDTVSQAYENDSNTKEEVEKLKSIWDKYYIRISYIAKTDFLNDISANVGRLEYLLENGSDEFVSELENIRTKATLLYNSQFPYLYSVL